MYKRIITRVRSTYGETCDFTVTKGVHQGSTLSPYLFALIMDELTAHIKDRVHWSMLFAVADDIVLVDESKDCVNGELKSWPETLEPKGFKISHKRTIYGL